MPHKVTISSTVMEWAIGYSDLSPKEIYKKFPWSACNPVIATVSQVEEFSKGTRVPSFYLLVDKIPTEKFQLGIQDFRTPQDKKLEYPSLNLQDILHLMTQRQDWMRDYLTGIGAQNLKIIGAIKKISSITTAAQRLRELLDLDVDWQKRAKNWELAFKLLCDKMEGAGILVFLESGLTTAKRMRFNPEEFRGFTISDPIAPILFINAADAKSAQMFTAVHECVHLARGDSGVYDCSINEKEKVTNQIAAEFLVPEKEFRKEWESEKDYYRLSKTFKVSPLVIARRALDTNLISPGQYWEFYWSEVEKWKKRKKDGGGSFYATKLNHLSNNFSTAITTSALAGETLLLDAYRLLRLKTNSFRIFSEKLLEGTNVPYRKRSV